MIGMFLKHKYLAAAIIGLLSLSIICQIIMGVLLHIMIRESGNMPAAKNKFLKQCKMKFINYYKLNGRMVNTSVFVDKFIQKITFLKIPLLRFSHIPGQLMMLSDYSLLSFQYTWTVSLFFHFRTGGYSGKEKDSEDKSGGLSGKSSGSQAGG